MNIGKETETIEFKKSTSELKEAMISIASILNKHGQGTLYFGVRSNGEVVGQEAAESTLRKISQAIGNSISPTIYPSIRSLQTDDGLTYIEVSFTGNEQPYACSGRYRIRVADEDLPVNHAELQQMFLHARAKGTPWDAWPSERPFSDIDELELRSFVERGNQCGRLSFAHTDAESTLERLKLLKNGKLTNAADILFCPSLRPSLKMGVLGSHARTEILDLHQEKGTLFQLVRNAEMYILNNTRRRFVITGEGPREEIPELPRTAVREVLFNAFTHRDWLSQGSVQIDIFSDTVEIFSPGWFIEGQHPDDHLSGRSVSSLTRNPLIAETLYKSKDIEAYGTGIPRLRDELNAAEIAFEYVKMADGTKFIFHRNDAFFIDKPDRLTSDKTVESSDKRDVSSDKTVESSGNKPQPIQRESIPWDILTKSEERACLFILEHESASSKEIAIWNSMTPRGTSQLLRRLVEKGVLVAHGENRNRTYSLKHIGSSPIASEQPKEP